MGTLKDDRKYWETYNGGIAFFKYRVKAIWFMFAVLKELSGFIPAVKKNIQEMYWILKKMQHINCIF